MNIDVEVMQLRYVQAEIWVFLVRGSAILDFWLPLDSHNIENSFLEYLDFENMDLAVGIMQLCRVQDEIQVFPVCGSAILDFWFPLASHNIKK